MLNNCLRLIFLFLLSARVVASTIDLNLIIDLSHISETQLLLTDTYFDPVKLGQGDSIRANASFKDGTKITVFNDAQDGEEFMYAALHSTEGENNLGTGNSGRSFSFSGVEGDLVPDTISLLTGAGNGVGNAVLGTFIIDNLTDTQFSFTGFEWELSDIESISDGVSLNFNHFKFNVASDAVLVSAADAQAISWKTAGVEPVMYFSGEPQESTISVEGLTGAAGFEYGAPLQIQTHDLRLSVGALDGSTYPRETKTLNTIFTVGSQSVTLTQEATFFQVGNGQFQLHVEGSPSREMVLPGVGILHISANAIPDSQFLANDSGQGAIVTSTLLLEPGRSRVQCPGDINGDGVADIVVVTPDGHATVKDLGGYLVSQFSFSAVTAVAKVVVLPDMNGNGIPELAALQSGSAKVEVRDMLTGAQLSVVNFEPYPAPADLELVDDQTGNGIPELAILGDNSVQVRDALTTELINSVPFSPDLDPKDLAVYPDLTGNRSPELGVLGDNKNPAKSGRLEVRDLAIGDTVQTIWLGKGWRMLQQVLLPDRNGNGSPEVAALRVRDSDGAVNVVMRDSGTRQGLGSIGFDRNYPPTHLLTIPDVNGNHADEVIVFGQRFDGTNQKAQIKDSKTHELIRAVFFDKNFPGQDMATCSDINGNGADELVLLGQRASDGKLKVIVKDAKTAKQIGAVNF